MSIWSIPKRFGLYKPHGIGFSTGRAHFQSHAQPLRNRVDAHFTPEYRSAVVVVHAKMGSPVWGRWNVQIHHGLGDKGHAWNPYFLQRGHFPMTRKRLNSWSQALGRPGGWMTPSSELRRRKGRYQQVNAFGPRFVDVLEDLVKDLHISRHGHVALNEQEGLTYDPKGPLLWLPSWDISEILGGPCKSSIPAFTDQMIKISKSVPFQSRFHPSTIEYRQFENDRQRISRAKNIKMIPRSKDMYTLLNGIRGLVTDTSSVGFEAYCNHIPVAVVRPPGVEFEGLHAELEERTPVFDAGDAALEEWMAKPTREFDEAWISDLLYPPAKSRNDEFAKDLIERCESRSGRGS